MFRVAPPPSLPFTKLEQFGVRSASQLKADVSELIAHAFGGESEPPIGLKTAGLFRPDLSWPAYAQLIPSDGMTPIFNLFDRVGGGRGFRRTVTRNTCRDFRGGRLTYDEHDGVDFVCPPGTPLVAAAPGIVVATRDNFLRGGLTACVDHGSGVVTQYTHLSRMVAELGQPVARGEVVALSGTAGFDMVSGFPWVPPHIHFMVWVHGSPVDPYLAKHEDSRAGTWLHGNTPETSGELKGDRVPAAVDINLQALEQTMAVCRSSKIAELLQRAPTDGARLALCEDSLHHDRDAWPADVDVKSLRPPADASSVKLTLPLPKSEYRGAKITDAIWTRP